MVKHIFDCFFSFSEPPEIRTVEGFSAVFAFVRCEHRLCTQIKRDTNFATPGYSVPAIISRRRGKSKIILSVVIPVVKAVFVPLSAIRGNPANAGVARLCGVSPCPIPDTTTALPNQARYQLRYTRIFNFCHDTTARGKNKDFSVCGHLCGQSRFCAVFGNRRKTRYHPCRKALRAFVQAAHG